MATKVYCDICGKEIENPMLDCSSLSFSGRSINSFPYDINDICRTCFLDIKDEIERKIKFYHNKHEVEDGCKNYTINTNVPETQKVYDWQIEDFGYGDWFIDEQYCGNCHTKLDWSWWTMRFCPNCGFMFNGVKNPNPPEEDFNE